MAKNPKDIELLLALGRLMGPRADATATRPAVPPRTPQPTIGPAPEGGTRAAPAPRSTARKLAEGFVEEDTPGAWLNEFVNPVRWGANTRAGVEAFVDATKRGDVKQMAVEGGLLAADFLVPGPGGKPKMPKRWAVISPENPGGTKVAQDVNDRLLGEMRRYLDEKGITYRPTKGEYTDNITNEALAERGFYLEGVSAAEAEKIGRMFGQNSVLTHRGFHDLQKMVVHPSKGVSPATGLPYTDIPGLGRITADVQWDVSKPRSNPEIEAMWRGMSRDGDKFPKVDAIDERAAARMADIYESLPVFDPEAKAAYDALASEVDQQFKAIQDAGYKIEFVDQDPYKSSTEMMADVRDNRTLKVFKTNDENPHPFLSKEQNDRFRAVHDFLAHAGGGNQFGPVGEENAYRIHAQTLSPLARRALATETRGQNSWVNFGPNRNLPAAQRPFATQKAALWPEGFLGDYGSFPEEPMRFPGETRPTEPFQRAALPPGFDQSRRPSPPVDPAAEEAARQARIQANTPAPPITLLNTGEPFRFRGEPPARGNRAGFVDPVTLSGAGGAALGGAVGAATGEDADGAIAGGVLGAAGGAALAAAPAIRMSRNNWKPTPRGAVDRSVTASTTGSVPTDPRLGVRLGPRMTTSLPAEALASSPVFQRSLEEGALRGATQQGAFDWYNMAGMQHLGTPEALRRFQLTGAVASPQRPVPVEIGAGSVLNFAIANGISIEDALGIYARQYPNAPRQMLNPDVDMAVAEKAVAQGVALPTNPGGVEHKVPTYAAGRLGMGGELVEDAPGSLVTLDTMERQNMWNAGQADPEVRALLKELGIDRPEKGMFPLVNAADYQLLSNNYVRAARTLGFPTGMNVQGARWVTSEGLRSLPFGDYQQAFDDQMLYANRLLGRGDDPRKVEALARDVVAGRQMVPPYYPKKGRPTPFGFVDPVALSGMGGAAAGGAAGAALGGEDYDQAVASGLFGAALGGLAAGRGVQAYQRARAANRMSDENFAKALERLQKRRGSTVINRVGSRPEGSRYDPDRETYMQFNAGAQYSLQTDKGLRDLTVTQNPYTGRLFVNWIGTPEGYLYGIDPADAGALGPRELRRVKKVVEGDAVWPQPVTGWEGKRVSGASPDRWVEVDNPGATPPPVKRGKLKISRPGDKR